MTGDERAEQRVVTTDDGVRLHTRLDAVRGRSAAPTLLLINSLGCDLGMWDQQVETWRTTHHVVRYDQRGHGRSDAPAGPYALEQFGRDALAVLDAFGIERADVCGLSLGGLVTQWLGLEAADRVDRAVLADTAARIGTADAWRERAALVRRAGMAAATDLVLERFFSPQALAADLPAVARIRTTLNGMSPQGYASSCDALADADLRRRVARIRHRCLVVVGTADVATPPTAAKALAAGLVRATYAELAGAGHLSNLERPAVFAELVGDFLASTPGLPAAAPSA